MREENFGGQCRSESDSSLAVFPAAWQDNVRGNWAGMKIWNHSLFLSLKPNNGKSLYRLKHRKTALPPPTLPSLHNLCPVEGTSLGRRQPCRCPCQVGESFLQPTFTVCRFLCHEGGFSAHPGFVNAPRVPYRNFQKFLNISLAHFLFWNRDRNKQQAVSVTF